MNAARDEQIDQVEPDSYAGVLALVETLRLDKAKLVLDVARLRG